MKKNKNRFFLYFGKKKELIKKNTFYTKYFTLKTKTFNEYPLLKCYFFINTCLKISSFLK